MKLFIVESPSKCAKLKKILGADYSLIASAGHIMEIPKKGMNIDFETFEPKYVVSDSRQDIVNKIKIGASKADEIILATDPDREGEAIAKHIYNLLPKKDQNKCFRASFNEISKAAVTKSLAAKGPINEDTVNAQKARQVLDRLIGYKISPLLWKSIAPKTSAGRVQSIALKIVVDKEREIEAFKSTDFYHVDASLKCKNGDFTARVVTDDKDNRYLDKKVAKTDTDILKKASYEIDSIERKEELRKASPPFDTASLQTTCSVIFKWPVKKTASLAQELYNKGFTTYIRTDSYNIADEAMDEVRKMIKKSAGEKYLPSSPNKYAKKSAAAKSAQEAHECIRPTDCSDAGGELNGDEKKLYKLIRERFVACQMAPMIVDTVVYKIKTSSGHSLIARGQTIKFDGWSKVYHYSKAKDEILPLAEDKESLNLIDVKMSEHKTQAPARYNEGSLIKKLEAEGVGRPSTYATMVGGIQERGYVEKVPGKKDALQATKLGMSICDYLVEHFNDFIMDIHFTALLEADLDIIEEGNKNFFDVVSATYKIMLEKISGATGTPVVNETKCLKCKEGNIVERNGKFGIFYACDQWPSCKCIYVLKEDGVFALKNSEKKSSDSSGDASSNSAKKSTKENDGACPDCEKKKLKGVLVKRNGAHGVFYGCSSYPKCKCIFVKDEKGELIRKK